MEAKRVNLQLQKINDQYPVNKKNRYTTDAFALNLQGMLYEASGSINEAFISYRNAVDLYLKHKGTFFGVSIPNQLKKDLLRTANDLGFSDEFVRYQKVLNFTYTTEQPTEGGELIIFWENGLIPYKGQHYFTFTILPGQKNGMVMVQNKELNLILPLPIKQSNTGGLSDIQIFRVAFPKYVARNAYYTSAQIKKENTTYPFQLIQNYKEIAFKTLRDRTLREIGKVALRLATKKMSEYLVKDNNKELGAVLGLFNALTEKADTRNWQSLPQTISYLRIPLKKGNNNLEVTFLRGKKLEKKQNITVTGTGRIIFKDIATLLTSKK